MRRELWSERVAHVAQTMRWLTELIYHGRISFISSEAESGDVHIPKLASGEALRVEMAHFRDCIRGRCTPQTDAEQGLEVVRILSAADASLAKEGEFVKI